MFNVLVYAFWVVLPVLHGSIGYRMWTGRLYREYPLFFAYVINQLIRFGILFYCYQLGIRDVYRLAYSSCEVVDLGLKFAVICELFSHVFRPYEGIRELGTILLRWASVILLLIASIVAAITSGSDSDRFLSGFFALERSVEIVQGGLLFLLFVLSSGLALPWERTTLGIALGFGVLTSIDLAAFSLRAQLGEASQDILSLIASAGYDCAVGIWLITLYVRKPARQLDHQLPHWDVESWNRALLELLRR
jgi:hypothetical protein